jgi:SpoVK/Ycf46/Vps4 family AAA+-type ATPase
LSQTERLAAFTAAAIDGEPVIFVHGPGADDAFVDSAYRVCLIEEAVWEALHAAGFGRIVFFSQKKKLYFLDEVSHRAVRPGRAVHGEQRPAADQAGGDAAVPHQRRRMRQGFSGPLGRRIVSGSSAGRLAEAGPPGDATPPGGPAAARPRSPLQRVQAAVSSITDQHGIHLLSGLIREGQPRTAVVFAHAEETLRHIQEISGLATLFAENFISYKRATPHTCVLLMSSTDLQDVHTFLERQNSVPTLANAAHRQLGADPGKNPGRIATPDDEELTRLVHAMRLAGGLRIGDWAELPRIVRTMVSQEAPAWKWQERLRQLARDDAPLDQQVLRDRGWVTSAVSAPGGVWERLARLRGMDAVKEHLERIRWKVNMDARLRASGVAQAEPPAYHLVFTGNPGTGKTTVAELVGEMYRDLGVLRKGHLVKVTAADLVSGYVGATAEQTNAAINRALDGVLFIDEAYQLSDQQQGHGKDAIDTLVARMDADRGRLVVIVAGYPDKMDEFLRSNEGLRSRFPEVLHFPDYPPDLLLDILLDRMRELGLTLDEDLPRQLVRAVDGLYRPRSRKSFGNARDMRTAADATYQRWAARVRDRPDLPVTAADLPDVLARHLDPEIPEMAELLGELDAMIGLAPVKSEVRRLVNRIQLNRRRARGEVIVPHMVFLGPPGTGKTTVARLMGRIFKTLGLLPNGDEGFRDVSRADLVGGYLGETAIKTRAQFDRAEGSVLFIDEAYSLSTGRDGPDQYGKEAIDTIVREMENRRGQMSVIVAGYEGPMEEFLRANPGLGGRFTARVRFPGYSTDELLEILRTMAAAEGHTLTDGALAAARTWFDNRRARDPESFANGRDARTLLATMVDRLAERVLGISGDTDLDTLTEQDVPGDVD